MKYNYNYILKRFEEKGYILLEDNYKNVKTKMRYICKKHKDYGEQTTNVDELLHYNKQCYKCKSEDLAIREYDRYIQEEDKIKALCEQNNWIYKGVKSINGVYYILYICNNHKDVGLQKIKKYNLKQGGKCSYCQNKHLTKENLINDKRIKDIEILDEYINDSTKMKCRCKKCGNIFYKDANHLKRGQGCNICNISKGENKIMEILNEKHVQYIHQYKFCNCKHINDLIFDFYIPNVNTAIEYNGEQHYKPVEHFGGEDIFKIQVIKDNKKRDYCKKNNINLIEISYKQFNNIEEIINNMLKTVETAGN